MDEIKLEPGTLDQGVSSASADLACECDVAASNDFDIMYNPIEQFLIDKCIEAVCAQNPSWYHYALHAKKARIRKKYLNKILNKAKYFARIYIDDYYKNN